MASFKVEAHTVEQFRKRALSLKPRASGVIATPAGWSKVQPNGFLELLVSFKGLDELLGSEVPDQVGEPLVLELEKPAEVTQEPVVEETFDEPAPEGEVAQEQTTESNPVDEPKKKSPGRPKKVE